VAGPATAAGSEFVSLLNKRLPVTPLNPRTVWEYVIRGGRVGVDPGRLRGSGQGEGPGKLPSSTTKQTGVPTGRLRLPPVACHWLACSDGRNVTLLMVTVPHAFW
jgi:hypothetical protein